jgi:hypothetical protein
MDHPELNGEVEAEFAMSANDVRDLTYNVVDVTKMSPNFVPKSPDSSSSVISYSRQSQPPHFDDGGSKRPERILEARTQES